MYCSKCGKEIPDESDFCSYCGADLQMKKDNNEEENSITENIICGIAIVVCVLAIIGLIYLGFKTYNGV